MPSMLPSDDAAESLDLVPDGTILSPSPVMSISVEGKGQRAGSLSCKTCGKVYARPDHLVRHQRSRELH